jgi:hypothetical protein
MEGSGAWRRLAAAIIARAVKDARSGNGYAAEARSWLLSSPLAAYLLDVVEVDRGRVYRWVCELEPLYQPALPL